MTTETSTHNQVDYVSVNSKPEHPPRGKTPGNFLISEFPTPHAKESLTPRAYKNELKPHTRGHFPQLFTIKT